MRTNYELRKLAVDISDGKVFGTWQLTKPEEVGQVFLGVTMLTAEEKAILFANIAHLYEYKEKGIEGADRKLIFGTCQTLTPEEVERLDEAIKDLEAIRIAFLAA